MWEWKRQSAGDRPWVSLAFGVGQACAVLWGCGRSSGDLKDPRGPARNGRRVLGAGRCVLGAGRRVLGAGRRVLGAGSGAPLPWEVCLALHVSCPCLALCLHVPTTSMKGTDVLKSD